MITKDVENWFPADYSPNFSVDDWVELLMIMKYLIIIV